MRCVVSFGMFVFILAVVQPMSSKSETTAIIIEPGHTANTLRQTRERDLSNLRRSDGHCVICSQWQSCEAHIGSGSDRGITDAQLNPVLDDVAPKDVRGEFKMGTFLNITCTKLLKPENAPSDSKGELVEDPCITCSGVSDDYERVNITKYGNTNHYTSVHITFKRPECKALEKAR
jgi:hypothetical protein